MVVRATGDSSYQALAARRDAIDRLARRDQIADVLSSSILDGTFRPGTRLSEAEICDALDVSRNTLREAFSSLVDRRLVTHKLNRGVFVRIPSANDVIDMYRCRRIIEGSALRRPVAGERLDRVRNAVAVASAAADARDWIGVGTADVDFHSGIAALNDSDRIDEFMATIWNEMRLVFHVMDDPEAFHRPYLERNRKILDALDRQDDAAETMILDYLDEAEQQILARYLK